MSTAHIDTPYDPAEKADADAYEAATGQLFVAGSINEAFRRWRDDPSRGGRSEFALVTPKQWVVHMYGLRDRHGAFLYPRWSWPASMGDPVSPPYDYNDQDAAVYYSQATNRLFAAGKIDEAFDHWRKDPCGGASLSYCGWSKEEFAEAFYGMRDVQGDSLYSRPGELIQAIAEEDSLDVLHDLMTHADEHYQRELVRAYGTNEAGDARYLTQHGDADVQAAKLAFHVASEKWHEAIESERASLHP
ncbi:MAG: hypothetical protein ACREPQ_00500 [Rhodanobacter sp.]